MSRVCGRLDLHPQACVLSEGHPPPCTQSNVVPTPFTLRLEPCQECVRLRIVLDWLMDRLKGKTS